MCLSFPRNGKGVMDFVNLRGVFLTIDLPVISGLFVWKVARIDESSREGWVGGEIECSSPLKKDQAERSSGQGKP